MSGLSQVKALAQREGWAILHDHESRFVAYKWAAGRIRYEVCVTADAAGRVTAVGQWENRRATGTDIDQEPGVRRRAEDLFRSWPEGTS